MASAAGLDPDPDSVLSRLSRRRVAFELALSYILILLVIWTPRPYQKWLWWVAAATVVVIAALSFSGGKTLGLRTSNLLRSLWVTGAALVLAGIAILFAIHLDTFRLPAGGIPAFIRTYWAYALWAGAQQLLLQGFFLPRCVALTQSEKWGAVAAAALFAAAHLPSPLLTPITLIWGLTACALFLRYNNLFPLALAHAIFGITIAITVPGSVDHNMRVGLGYLRYRHHEHRTPYALPHPAPQT